MESLGKQRQQEIIAEFKQCSGWEERYKHIIKVGKELPRLSDELYDDKFLVKGCQSQVWLHAQLNEQGQMILHGDSDAMIVKGLAALLLRLYSGLAPAEVLQTPPTFIEDLGFKDYLSPSRANGFLSMVKQIMLYAQAFTLTAKS